jgi:hypothetical protein
MEEMVGPSRKKGIHGVTDYLDDELRNAYYLLRNAPDPAKGNANVAALKAKNGLKAMQIKVNSFFEKDWKAFREDLKTYPTNLFHKFESEE